MKIGYFLSSEEFGLKEDAFFEAYREQVLPQFDRSRQLTHSGGG